MCLEKNKNYFFYKKQRFIFNSTIINTKNSIYSVYSGLLYKSLITKQLVYKKLFYLIFLFYKIDFSKIFLYKIIKLNYKSFFITCTYKSNLYLILFYIITKVFYSILNIMLDLYLLLLSVKRSSITTSFECLI